MAIAEANAALLLGQYEGTDPEANARRVHELHTALAEARDHFRNCEECESD